VKARAAAALSGIKSAASSAAAAAAAASTANEKIKPQAGRRATPTARGGGGVSR
jgi:hypothetical protein